jgi:hypothetical protein
MLRSLDELRGYVLSGRDGEIGRSKDFLFDDALWVVRYMVADTGKWLPGRRVLISPVALGRSDWTNRRLAVDLTRESIKQSPSIERDAPVSRLYEKRLFRHYGWPIYWGGGGVWGAYQLPRELAAERPLAEIPDDPDDPERSHLRSVKEVTGYRIQATDGEIGHVEDFIADDSTWAVLFMVVDTRNWLPGRKVLVAPHWIQSVDWAESTVGVEMTRQRVKESPVFDPSEPVNRDYVERLYDYYGRPRPVDHTAGR